jgi:hypothetical protein
MRGRLEREKYLAGQKMSCRKCLIEMSVWLDIITDEGHIGKGPVRREGELSASSLGTAIKFWEGNRYE